MCLLLETIRVSDGILCHPGYHQARMDRCQNALFPGSSKLDIAEIHIPDTLKSGIYKCRIIYGSNLEKIEFLPYVPKIIRTLGLVDATGLNYSFKYVDRSDIEQLHKANQDFDEIILVKNGDITDTTYSNLAFLSGERWFTPIEPLLGGTCRQRLIDQGILHPIRISPEDLSLYTHVSLINAMLDLGDIMLPVRSIYTR